MKGCYFSRQLSIPGPEHERTLLARRIEATDRQIDRLVYELYGLTDEEIGLVEGETDEWLFEEHFPKMIKKYRQYCHGLISVRFAEAISMAKKIILAMLVLMLAASLSLVSAQKGIHEPGTGLANPELKEAA